MEVLHKLKVAVVLAADLDAAERAPVNTAVSVSGRRQGLTLVHFSAQPEPFLTQHAPYTRHKTPYDPIRPHKTC